MTNKLLRSAILATVLMASGLFAQPDHLLISEFVVTPTAGEFIEIHNPTSSTVDLTNFYLSDASFLNDNDYINVVSGTFAVGSGSDFMVKFPDATTIAPGQHMTIAFSGAGFMTEYSVAADFEILADDAGVTDMTAISVGASAGLSNGGEMIMLFYWDGTSDLVMDVDYVVWGDKDEAVDKSGVAIDGPDADSDASTYADDTAKDDQTVVNTDNDDDSEPHDFGSSAQRRLDVEDIENWSAGGNGMTGHDETGENTSWKGGIWSINEPATPGRRALSPKAPADSLTIADVRFVRADSIGTDNNDDSPFLGQTLSLTGIWMQGTREVALGNRWGGFLMDPRSGPWSGFFIIQNDTSAGTEGTLLTAAEPGDLIRITGVMAEFPTTPNTPSIAQLNLITDPVTPIEFVEAGLSLPDPVVLTPGDLGLTSAGNSADPQLSERWEGVFARFENVTVTNNDGTAGSNTMIAGDATGSIIIDDYFSDLSDFLDTQNGIWPGFPSGTVINVTGFVRGGTTSGNITINPRDLDDIEVAATPPAISEPPTRTPATPTSTQSVDVSVTITSASSTIASAEVSYRVDGGAFTAVAMTAGANDLYTGSVPSQADGALVEYFIKATDATGFENSVPSDTASAKFFYTVRDAGPTVFDLQFTPFANGNSSYIGLEATVTGIVTSDSTDFAFYYIQDGTGPWTGIYVNDTANDVALGDEVTVTGPIREQFGVTQINSPTNVTINSRDNTVPDPSVVTTGELASGTSAESWESVLVRVQNVTVTNARPDGAPGFGEFSVDDGSGEVRVDDLSSAFVGQPQSAETTYPEGATIESMTAIHYFSFGNFKLAPRNDDDIVGLVVSVDSDDLVPLTFGLDQNYPNPFNPETTIRYQLAQQGDVRIQVFNILGQRVRTLVDQVQPAGNFSVRWDATDDHGARVATGVYIYRMTTPDFVKSQKMLLLK